jgi:CRISPR-associated protein Cas5t
MFCIYLQAPFTTFRTFTAGSFRPTTGFITPSAAYGLLLNIAGIEMRQYDPAFPMTLIRKDLPKISLALGALSLPRQQQEVRVDSIDTLQRSLPHQQGIYQQLHNYPVGNTGKENAHRTKGNKYNITPVRRSFLVDLRAYLCLDASAEFEDQVKDGLLGKRPRSYGLPFLGDNNFLIDRLEPVGTLQPAHWFEQIGPDEEDAFQKQVMRLTITINRDDMSRTRSKLFAPTISATEKIPERAWVEVGY